MTRIAAEMEAEDQPKNFSEKKICLKCIQAASVSSAPRRDAYATFKRMAQLKQSAVKSKWQRGLVQHNCKFYPGRSEVTNINLSVLCGSPGKCA